VNRAHVTTHPRVVGGMLRVFVVAFVVLSPLLVFVVAQVHGTRSRYECGKLEKQINEAWLERRHLVAQKERLLAPDRLRVEAARLGLTPPTLEDLSGRRPPAPAMRVAPASVPVATPSAATARDARRAP
jgi:hypothetical protein